MEKERLLWFLIVGALVLTLIIFVVNVKPRSVHVAERPSARPAEQMIAAGRTISMGAETRACISCHEDRQITASAVRDWKMSAHAEHQVGCEKCHIPEKDAPETIRLASTKCNDKRVRSLVSARNCSPCHAPQVEQFSHGKHASAWMAMNAMPMMHALPPVVAERGCGACHNIGRDEGKCNSCHTRHLFATAEARKPEACQTCHMGFDHPQWEMYSTSKHGTVYRTQGQDWDWTRKLRDWFKEPYTADAKTPRAPTCAYCHMPKGDHTVKTAWGFLALRLAEKDKDWAKSRTAIFQGLGVVDEKGQPTERFKVVVAGDVARLSAEDWEKQRQRELDQCNQCHSQSFAEGKLNQADEVIKEADRLMAEAVEIVNGLYKDGILQKPADRPPHPDLLMFYETPNPIEQTLYTMFLEHRMRTFQGAFHMNPDYLHWYGWAEMRRDLEEIKAEAKRLRKEHGEKAKS